MSDHLTVKTKQFLRRLQAVGVVAVADRGKGGHYRLTCGQRKSILSFHGGADLTPTYMKVICKQLGLNIDDVI
jgi:predicted RNA binding protein YcfA (HicA-like mRNA interferase family)